MAEQIGTVTHYFGEPEVAVIEVESGALEVGDRVRIVGGEDSFDFVVESMEIDHEPVDRVEAGDAAGVQVPEKAWEGADVLLVGEEE